VYSDQVGAMGEYCWGFLQCSAWSGRNIAVEPRHFQTTKKPPG
jgi:hypothetical protein